MSRLEELLADRTQILTHRRDIALLFDDDDEGVLDGLCGLAQPTWERITGRDDLDAMIHLSRLCPGETDAVASAEHDQIWLAWTVGDLKGKATVEFVLNLRRSNVFEDGGDLSMFA